MVLAQLLPAIPDLHVDEIRIATQSIQVEISFSNEKSACPSCDQLSERVHSHYSRRVADLTWAGREVILHLNARKYFCIDPFCKQKIFTERFGLHIGPFARRTNRLTRQLEFIGFLLGGEAGAALATMLGIKTSHDTILRIVSQKPDTSFESPKVLGVDDWAIRKGHTYGTILVDLESRKPIDLLSERSAESLAMWLEDHPGVEIISRDRASCYAEGAKQGAPKAIQIADRWHLLKNSGDAFQRLLKGHPKAIREATQQMNQQETTLKTDDPAPACTTDSHETSSVAVPQPIPTEAETRRQMNFQQVKLLQQQESGIREISRQVGISRHTVRTYMAVDTLPERAVPANRSPKINPYLAYLAHRWNEGEHKFKNLFEEIQAQGYTGSLVSLYKAKIRFAGTDCLKGKSQKAAPKYRSLSARKATMLLCKDPEKLNPEQERFCEALCQCCPEVETAKTLIYDFNEIVKNQLENSLDSWLDKALATDIKQIRNFATGLKSDYQAVHAALTYSWSNGQVEGQVNRLKNIKRQMYGRANFSLLRKRVLYAPRPP